MRCSHLTGMIDVRMAEEKLVGLRIQHVGNVVSALLASNHRIEANVHQHVAQLLHHVVMIVAHDGIAELEGLFYRVRTQAFICLLVVPGAFLAQLVQHIEQSPESLHLFLSRVHSFLFFGKGREKKRNDQTFRP